MRLVQASPWGSPLKPMYNCFNTSGLSLLQIEKSGVGELAQSVRNLPRV